MQVEPSRATWMPLCAFEKTYCREADDPAARSLRTLRNDAVVSSPERASRGIVADRWGESGRKRTVNKLCPREVISVLTNGVSSCVHSVRVVSTTGPGRETVQLRLGLEISLGFCVSQRWREISRWKLGESSRSASKVTVSRWRLHRQISHCTSSGRGRSLTVTRAFSNQWAAKCNCACRQLRLDHFVSTTRARIAQAASTHFRTRAPLRRLYREKRKNQSTSTAVAQSAAIAIRRTTKPQMRMVRLRVQTSKNFVVYFLQFSKVL